MPYALIIAGLVLLVSGVRGTQGQLFSLLKGDITGPHNFEYWIISILVIGALGYIPDLKTLSRAFLVLVIVVLVLSNGGFFQNFNQGIFSQSGAA